MKAISCQLENTSKFLKNYLNETREVQSYFDYSYKDIDLVNRKDELTKRSFRREDLVEYLLDYNRKYNCSEKTIHNIEKLINQNCLTIVGGQQAGVLTGPLYTIHKIVTILKLAKEQEEKLAVPVVPVFWVAGEDHDFDEVNHIYTEKLGKLHKRKVNQLNESKRSIAQLHLNKDVVKSFILEVLRDFKETEHTTSLLEKLNSAIDASDSYVDFFSRLIHDLFHDTGIILLDSHSPEIRKLEQPFFQLIVENNKKINDAFINQANHLYGSGYGEPIERNNNNANLFYHLNGTRLSLERDSSELFTDKLSLCQFEKDDLLKLVESEPYNFSNNVVTRPLMQEYVLPVLAFVAGPGEIAYWATLKEVFHLFNWKVPPIVPRLSITLIDPKVEVLLRELQLTPEQVMKLGTEPQRMALGYWDEKERIEELLHQTLDQLEELHSPIKNLAISYDKGLEGIAHKNELILKQEITFLARKIEKNVRQKYEHELLNFDKIDSVIRPNRGLQERSLNIMKYLNDYGFDWVNELVELPMEIDGSHKVIYIN